LPLGADPHGYQPTPDDLRAISDAHLVFVNGLGLEEGLASILEEAHPKTVPVNVGIEVITTAEEEEHAEGEEEEEHHHEGGNPHTWWSIAVVEQWTHNIEQSLSAVDPAHAESYAANAEAYRAELSSLKAEMETLVSQIPVSERKLATDHDTLAYFARDFDFQIVGLIVPSFSTLAEPSAQHLAQLQDQLRAENVGAVFVGSTVNPRQAEQLAQDLGIRVVPIFTDSLSAADGPAATYVDFMRYNVKAIVAALVAAP
jgi:manganese/iron transport system substrate-binding protein